MAEHSPLLTELIDSLKLLPGIGQKSAQRMALHLLKVEQDKSIKLGQVICKAVENIKHCSQCRNYTEEQICEICNSPNRKSTQMCIVETPTDLMAIENGTTYNGVYFVLMGKLSPLDGIGPEQLGLDKLEERLQSIERGAGIPAAGLVLIPEASSGCVCSYSIQTSMAFRPTDPRK